MADHSPLPPIRQEDISLVRRVEGGQQMVTRYYDRSGNEILTPTYHMTGVGLTPTQAEAPAKAKAKRKRT